MTGIGLEPGFFSVVCTGWAGFLHASSWDDPGSEWALHAWQSYVKEESKHGQPIQIPAIPLSDVCSSPTSLEDSLAVLPTNDQDIMQRIRATMTKECVVTGCRIFFYRPRTIPEKAA
ncbi:hypothetical protein ACRALDRAFT_2041112 [Sodiomyces alcalophilus JCM 7366]|uniref:uncharacterized protein n=1 Tax=Sodiomyces alcalophilus JCM 7366 TaxID=591952 RepID=UPI0039B55EF3